jgi:hypothetical protein
MADEATGGLEQLGVAHDAVAPFWQVPLEFAVHGLVGTSIFAIVAVLAIALDLCVHRLEAYKISPAILIGLKAATLALFASDMCLFGVFLWRTSGRMIKKL